MATIASLLVNLKANTFDFDKGMKSASVSTQTFEKSVRDANAAITKASGLDTVANYVKRLTGEWVKLKFAMTDAANTKVISKLEADLEKARALNPAADSARNFLKGVAIGERSRSDAASSFANLQKRFGAMDVEGPSLQRFNSAMKLLQGGGALIGVSLLGQSLKDMTDKMVEFVEATDSGGKSAKHLVQEFAAGLPVIGGFVGAALNLAKLSAIAGEKLWRASNGFENEPKQMAIGFDQDIMAAEIKKTEDAFRIQSAPVDQRELVKATIAYEDEMKRIEDATRAALTADKTGSMIVDDWSKRAQAVAQMTFEEAKLAAQELAGKAAADKYADAVQRISPVLEAMKDPQQKFIDWFNEARPLFEAAGQSVDTFTKAADHMREQIFGKNPLDEFFAGTEKASSGLASLVSMLQQPIGGNALEATAQVEKMAKAFEDAVASGVITMEQYNKASELVGKGLDEALTSDAMSLLEQVKTPIEKLGDMEERLQILLEANKINQTEFDKILAFERNKLFPEDKKTPVAAFEKSQGGPGLAERGSQDAFRALSRFVDGQKSSFSRTERLQEDTNRELKQANRTLRAIERANGQNVNPIEDIP